MTQEHTPTVINNDILTVKSGYVNMSFQMFDEGGRQETGLHLTVA